MTFEVQYFGEREVMDEKDEELNEIQVEIQRMDIKF